MLSPAELAALSRRIAANADRLIQAHQKDCQTRTVKPERQPAAKGESQERRGRPPKRIVNPFAGFIGPTTAYGRYPFFAQDIIEGIARLDWHDRPIGKGGSSKPLSVRSLMVILEQLEEITTEGVQEIIGTKARQAQRYVKAVELAIPYLLQARPRRLVLEMDLPQDEAANEEYRQLLRQRCPELVDELEPPSAADLARLRQALGDDAFDDSPVINAAYYKEETSTRPRRKSSKGHRPGPTINKGRRKPGSNEVSEAS